MRVLKHRKMDRPRAVNRKRHADNAERQPIHVTKGETVRVNARHGLTLLVEPERVDKR